MTQLALEGLRRFYDLSLAGDDEGLLGLFGGRPSIDSPIHGAARGEAGLRRFAGDHRAWLAGRAAAARLVNVVAGDERLVLEWILDLTQDGETIDLPVAIAADLEDGLAAALRIYHSTWPLDGRHQVRGPLLSPVDDLEEPPVIQAYMRGIAEADLEAVLALFVEDGYAREPSGQRYKYTGPEGLRRFYSAALGAGGIALKHCSATFDGMSCAVEYICDEWAGVALPPQSGIAVYELAGPDRLRAARIYDDVEPPFG